MVRFVAINDYGNRFFMDNININGQNILTVKENRKTSFNSYIYPNPSKGIFTIRTDTENTKVEVYSTLGKLILKDNIIKGVKQIDISKESKGIYFIRLQNNEKIIDDKIILK